MELWSKEHSAGQERNVRNQWKDHWMMKLDSEQDSTDQEHSEILPSKDRKMLKMSPHLLFRLLMQKKNFNNKKNK